ncbi:tetraacyldisaccharide 4'-kinase [Flavobacterium sp.]|uniref:tetraacyldisaccharide 4'-kinase n=1 Tax=Flavobacterium sp. TaxID=239 RepID=UPI002611F633|nr:tetraacyldisaccharide 4'-kinase [Flavobacterium sp.]
MIILRYLLFPFALLYGCITAVRNYCYQIGIFKSYRYNLPIIAVGNLSVGGTGKTPQIEALIRLLQPRYRLATLSRGYGRSSKGYIVANDLDSIAVNDAAIGDEPYQMFLKFPNITVAVAANRSFGIDQLVLRQPPPEIVLLDDAFQHRRVHAGLYILLTAYNDLFCNDWMLPTGTLREFTSGKNRANMIIVTKCPADLSELEQQKIHADLGVFIPVYFSTICYDSFVYNANGQFHLDIFRGKPKVLLAGIAKPEPFYSLLQEEGDTVLRFPDHHDFSAQDIEKINRTAQQLPILTTEKDYVRLIGKGITAPIYYLPIQSQLLAGASEWQQQIEDYVGSSARNR